MNLGMHGLWSLPGWSEPMADTFHNWFAMVLHAYVEGLKRDIAELFR